MYRYSHKFVSFVICYGDTKPERWNDVYMLHICHFLKAYFLDYGNLYFNNKETNFNIYKKTHQECGWTSEDWHTLKNRIILLILFFLLSTEIQNKIYVEYIDIIRQLMIFTDKIEIRIYDWCSWSSCMCWEILIYYRDKRT